MSLAIVAGLSVLALEIIAIAWLLGWMFADAATWQVIGMLYLIASPLTAILWAIVAIARCSNDASAEADEATVRGANCSTQRQEWRTTSGVPAVRRR